MLEVINISVEVEENIRNAFKLFKTAIRYKTTAGSFPIRSLNQILHLWKIVPIKYCIKKSSTRTTHHKNTNSSFFRIQVFKFDFTNLFKLNTRNELIDRFWIARCINDSNILKSFPDVLTNLLHYIIKLYQILSEQPIYYYYEFSS